MSASSEGKIVHDPVFKHRLRFEDATDEHGAPAVLCEMWVDPGGGVPPHVHPRMEERFTVVEGRAEFLSGRMTQLGIPKGLKGLLAGAVMLDSYKEMVVMGFPPLPPPAIQRLLVPPLARFAERRGYRAGRLG